MCALGCRVDIKNKLEMTPLHTATQKNEIDAVRCLCLAGLDLNITNREGLTAEQLAISLKHTAIANLLSSLRKVFIYLYACFLLKIQVREKSKFCLMISYFCFLFVFC